MNPMNPRDVDSMQIDTVAEAVRELRRFRQRAPLAILPLSESLLRDLDAFYHQPGACDIDFKYFAASIRGPVLVLFPRGMVSFLDLVDRAGALCMN